MPKVLYPISHGFAARTVLHSAVVPELRARDADITIASVNGDEPHFRSQCERLGAHSVQFAINTLKFGSLLHEGRRYLFEDLESSPPLLAKHLRDKDRDARAVIRLRAHMGQLINASTQWMPQLRAVAARWERSVFRHSRVRALLRQLSPDVVVSTYPVNMLEATFLAEAQRLGILTVGQLLSWDNITCKGRWPVLPERFVTWGPIMTQELREHYGVPGRHICECGVAHFDHHRQIDMARWCEPTLAGLGLEPARPYIFFGMSAGYFAPNEIDIVEWLAERVRSDQYGESIQLLVRPHPQTIRGGMTDAAILPRLRALMGDRVAVDFPQMMSEKLAWDIHCEDIYRLAAMLRGACVTINSGSTLCIDAMLHDKPVILTYFDAGRSVPWHRSARRVIEYPHLEKLCRFDAMDLCSDFESLDRALKRNIGDPGLRSEARKAALAAEVSVHEATTASRRIAEAVIAFAAETTAVRSTSAK